MGVEYFQLEAPMVFNRYQKPVKLPSQDSYQGMQGIVLGWGKSLPDGRISEYLQKLYPTVRDISYCGTKLFANMALQTGLVCVVLPKGKGACNVSFFQLLSFRVGRAVWKTARPYVHTNLSFFAQIKG